MDLLTSMLLFAYLTGGDEVNFTASFTQLCECCDISRKTVYNRATRLNDMGIVRWEQPAKDIDGYKATTWFVRKPNVGKLPVGKIKGSQWVTNKLPVGNKLGLQSVNDDMYTDGKNDQSLCEDDFLADEESEDSVTHTGTLAGTNRTGTIRTESSTLRQRKDKAKTLEAKIQKLTPE